MEAKLTTALISHPAGLGHAMGEGHPERPDRLRALLAAWDDPAFAALTRLEAPPGDRTAMERCHPAAYIDALLAARPGPGRLSQLDPDTAMGPGTWNAVERTIGGACLAVDVVAGGAARNAFLAMRPPGHHAERAKPMGFCFLNQAAIAARHAQAVHGVGRVAIVDFDVHHGNGTQDIFWTDPSVLYGSTHEMPLYPGTGRAGERGEHGTIVNAPLAPGDGGEAFRAAMTGRILPALEAFGPEFVIVSAGFDAHRRDPLATLRLEAADFAWVSEELLAIADRHAGGRLVSILEGGYDLEGLVVSASAHLKVLIGDAPMPAPNIAG